MVKQAHNLLYSNTIHQLGLEFYLFMGPLFLVDKPFISFSRILGQSISRFDLWLLTFANYFYPLGL
jgi:hypothetical protein